MRKVLPKPGSRDNADDLAAMTAFYNAPAGALLWVTESGLSDKARTVVAEVRRADDWGLRSRDFTLPQLDLGRGVVQTAAEAEIELTLAVLKYARYARGGRIRDPSRISNCSTTRHLFIHPRWFSPNLPSRMRPTPICARCTQSTGSSRGCASCY